MAEKKKTSLFTWLVLILIVLSLYISNQPDKEVTPSSKPIALTEREKIHKQLDFDFVKQVIKDGMMVVTLSLKNNSDTAIKDIMFRCSEFSKSNKVVTRHVQTAYEILPAKTDVEYTIVMGATHPQADRSQCALVTFEY